MTQPTCGLCARPMPDTAYVCSRCTDDVAKDLARIVDLAGEVEPAIAKLVKRGSGVGSSGHKERPLPVDLAAAERAAAIGNTVATWARHVSESRGIPLPVPVVQPQAFGPLCGIGVRCEHWSCDRIRVRRREVGAEAAARWLIGQLGWLRHRPEAIEAMTELRNASSDLERLVGRPRDLWYAGPCWRELEELDDDGQPKRCENELYAVPGKALIRCKECDAEWDATKRKEWLLEGARDTLAHAALIAAALTALGMSVAVGTVYSWASRGRIVAHGSDALGRPLYRVGEAIDLLSRGNRRVA